MMKNKLFRMLICILCVCMTIPLLCASAAAADRDVEKTYDHLNKSTGYRICVFDEEKLLAKPERLVETWKPLTDYCSVIFWSCRLSEAEQDKQVDVWQDGGFAKDSLVIAVNMEESNYQLYASGAVYRAVPQDELQQITDSLSEDANNSDFDAMAKSCGSQVYRKLSGKELPAPVSDKEAVRYQNSETGYRVMIIDDADLISDIEEAMLADSMKPITEYGHIVFWTTEEKASDAEIQARDKRYAYFGRDSAGILSINMAKRKVVFHADGAMYKAVNASDARTITDNVSHYASEKDYYSCAKEAFDQVLMRLRGQAIAEPMKYTSYTVIALMLAFVIVVGLAFGVFNPLRKKNKQPVKLYGSGMLLASEPIIRKTGSETRAWVIVLMTFVASMFSGGGSSGGGGGGSGGGSSGGSGGGGSSSF